MTDDFIWVRQSDGTYIKVKNGNQWDNDKIYDNNDGYPTSV